MKTSKRTIGTGTKPTTPVAELARIGRINPVYFNPFSLSLIGNEVLQLAETPVAEPVIHSPASSLLSYAFEVFHYNPVAIEIGNDVLADVMVIPSHKPFLFSSNFSKQPSAGMSAFGLQPAAQIFEFPFNFLDSAAVIESAVRSDSKIIYAEVNAKNPMISRAGINLFGKSKQEENPSLFVHPEQAFPDIPGEIFPIAGRNIEWQFDSALDSRQAQDAILEGCTPWEIVSDADLIDNWFALGSLDYSAGLLDAGYCQLSRQSSFPEMAIDERMQFDIIFDFMLPCLIDTELQSPAVNLYSFDNLWSSRNLDFSCSPANHIHAGHYRYINLMEDGIHP